MRYRITVFFVLSISLFFLVILFGWEFWTMIGVPSYDIMFVDFEIIKISSKLVSEGIDPRNHNIDGLAQLNYPSIWIKISDFLNLHSGNNGVFVVVIMIFLYCYVNVDVINKTNSLIPIFFFFSGSSLLLIERGNTDLLIIFLSYLISKNIKYLTGFIFISSVMLKIYPIFLYPFIFFKNKYRFLILVITSSLIFWFKEDLLLSFNLTPKSSSTSFGTNSISIILERYLALEINFLIISILFILISFFLYNKFYKGKFSIIRSVEFENLFICGSSILILSFLATSNWDYRLSFLILCIPYLSLHSKKLYGVFITLSLISMHYSIEYFFLGKIGSLINLLSKVTLFILLTVISFDILIKNMYDLKFIKIK